MPASLPSGLPLHVVLTEADILHFRTFGFVVLRHALDPGPLSNEVDRALHAGFRRPFAHGIGGGGHYVPMMCERTPVSLSLLDQFAAAAATLLGKPVLPVRAKCVSYYGAARWHSDSMHSVASVGFACYLEPLDAGNGALRVLPGSHRSEFGSSLNRYFATCQPTHADVTWEDWVAAVPALPVCTDPGDVIAFDEHLFHASARGRDRRQWRVDYVADVADSEAEAPLRAYYSAIFPPDWDGGYDVDLYPTYGPHWLASGRPCLQRLAQLGATGAAEAQEAFSRGCGPPVMVDPSRR